MPNSITEQIRLSGEAVSTEERLSGGPGGQSATDGTLKRQPNTALSVASQRANTPASRQEGGRFSLQFAPLWVDQPGIRLKTP